MASGRNYVNLDAMITRADFALEEGEETGVERIQGVGVRDLGDEGLLRQLLRKPDFQRETNHWTPDQVVSLLVCFANDDLIPSVILWKSARYVFVIDGGHRLSVLRAWVLDDYGDGPLSHAYFGVGVTRDQLRVAQATREVVARRLGSWQHFQAKAKQENLEPEERRRVTSVFTRALPIQWVTGNADKAESSFFNINTAGTPLDSIEELLLRHREKPIAIAARAVIRAGQGHRYWSKFGDTSAEIERKARELHRVLFEPELDSPVKTLDLPLAGGRGFRAALQMLIDFIQIANRTQTEEAAEIEREANDVDGSGTVRCLDYALRIARWVTGNTSGSLGLHPAIYFYGPTGRHSGPMFLGTVALVAKHVVNNDKGFFRKFSEVRAPLEQALIAHKDLIASVLQRYLSPKRVASYRTLLEAIVLRLAEGETISAEWIVGAAGLGGKLVTGTPLVESQRFSEEARSAAFVTAALEAALKCPVCGGYLDPGKSVSYDHIERVREGGRGDAENCQLVHPYCNQAVRQ